MAGKGVKGAVLTVGMKVSMFLVIMKIVWRILKKKKGLNPTIQGCTLRLDSSPYPHKHS